MSLFDVIKYGNIDIESKRDMYYSLPPQVVTKWHARVVEHACQSAESIAHQDKKCQILIDMTREYMRGEVDNDALDAAYNADRSAAGDEVRNASGNAANAANSNYAIWNAARSAANVAYWVAKYADRNATDDAVYRAAKNAALKLYKEWIMEELMNYDPDDFLQLIRSLL